MRGRRKAVPPRNIHFPLRHGLYKPYELYELSVSHRRARIKRANSIRQGNGALHGFYSAMCSDEGMHRHFILIAKISIYPDITNFSQKNKLPLWLI